MTVTIYCETEKCKKTITIEADDDDPMCQSLKTSILQCLASGCRDIQTLTVKEG